MTTVPTIDPYLIFDGNCAEAMQFYERTLGGKLEKLMRMADMPTSPTADCAPGNPDFVVHACLDLAGRKLMASDAMGQPYSGMSGFSVSLVYPASAEAT